MLKIGYFSTSVALIYYIQKKVYSNKSNKIYLILGKIFRKTRVHHQTNTSWSYWSNYAKRVFQNILTKNKIMFSLDLGPI